MRARAIRRLRVYLVSLRDRARRHPVVGEVYEAVDGTIGAFVRDDAMMYAGAIAFYAVLSFIPFLVLLASLTGFALTVSGSGDASDEAVRDVVGHVRRVVPYLGEEVATDVRKLVLMRRELGIVGFLVLLFASSQVFRGLEFGLGKIFGGAPSGEVTVPSRRRRLVSPRLLFGAVATALVLVIVAVRLGVGVLRAVREAVHMPEAVEAFLVDPLLGGEGLGRIVTAAALAVGFGGVVLAFHRTVRPRFALIGGVVFSLLFFLAHGAYDVYLGRMANLGALYGSFATVIVVVGWIYFSAALLLFCGYVVATAQRRVEQGPRWPKSPRRRRASPPVGPAT